MAYRLRGAARRAAITVSLISGLGLLVSAEAQAAVLAATPVTTIGGSATAQVYAWGAATMPDGSILIGDYWNLRIVRYNVDGTPATPFVFAG